MKKKKEEKEKLLRSSSYLSKKFIFLRMSKTFRFIRNVFFYINLKYT
jgi:hypothetical protein